MSTRRKYNAAAVLALVLTLSGCGLMAPRGHDGFASLDSPGTGDTHRVISLSLGPAVLHLAARFMDDEPETQLLLRSLAGVRVRAFEITGDERRVVQNLGRMGDRLGNDGWAPVMLVNEEGEWARMFAKSSGNDLHGLIVISAEDDEVVVINVMGDIQPAQFRDVMRALDVEDAPDVQLAALGADEKSR